MFNVYSCSNCYSPSTLFFTLEIITIKSGLLFNKTLLQTFESNFTDHFISKLIFRMDHFMNLIYKLLILQFELSELIIEKSLYFINYLTFSKIHINIKRLYYIRFFVFGKPSKNFPFFSCVL